MLYFYDNNVFLEKIISTIHPDIQNKFKIFAENINATITKSTLNYEIRPNHLLSIDNTLFHKSVLDEIPPDEISIILLKIFKKTAEDSYFKNEKCHKWDMRERISLEIAAISTVIRALLIKASVDFKNEQHLFIEKITEADLPQPASDEFARIKKSEKEISQLYRFYYITRFLATFLNLEHHKKLALGVGNLLSGEAALDAPYLKNHFIQTYPKLNLYCIKEQPNCLTLTGQTGDLLDAYVTSPIGLNKNYQITINNKIFNMDTPEIEAESLALYTKEIFSERNPLIKYSSTNLKKISEFTLAILSKNNIDLDHAPQGFIDYIRPIMEQKNYIFTREANEAVGLTIIYRYHVIQMLLSHLSSDLDLMLIITKSIIEQLGLLLKPGLSYEKNSLMHDLTASASTDYRKNLTELHQVDLSTTKEVEEEIAKLSI